MPVDTAEALEVSFQFFGLAQSASFGAVREAYRRYLKEFHPDLFPKDSDDQKMAAEKAIAANRHYEKLESFFEEFPEGKPVDEGTTRQEPHDESDWEAWDKERHNAFDDELKEWKARQEKIEQEKAAHRESFRRSKLVTYCRVGLVAITLFMWMGWFSELSKLNQGAENERNRQAWQSQNQQPHFIDPVTGIDVNEAWKQKVEKFMGKEGFVDPQEKLKKMPGKFILLLLFSAGAGWLLFSKRGKELVENYLAGAQKQ